jgi:hypothetical protein
MYPNNRGCDGEYRTLAKEKEREGTKEGKDTKGKRKVKRRKGSMEGR